MPEILPFPAERFRFEKLAPNLYVAKVRDTEAARRQVENLRRDLARCELPCDV